MTAHWSGDPISDFASGDSFETDSREEGVAYAVLRYVRRNLQRPEMLRLLALVAAESSAPDHPAHQWFRDRYERVVAGVASAIRRDHDKGRISNSRDHHEISQSLVALWDGLQLQWLIDPRRDLAARMTAALEDLLGTRVPTERLPSSPG